MDNFGTPESFPSVASDFAAPRTQTPDTTSSATTTHSTRDCEHSSSDQLDLFDDWHSFINPEYLVDSSEEGCQGQPLGSPTHNAGPSTQSFNGGSNATASDSPLAAETLSNNARGPHSQWDPKDEAHLKAIGIDIRPLGGMAPRKDWAEAAKKLSFSGRSAQALSHKYSQLMKNEIGDQRPWSEVENSVLRELIVTTVLGWTDITNLLAQKTRQPLRPIHNVKMYSFHNSRKLLLGSMRNNLREWENRDLTLEERAILLKWWREWQRWPDIHDSLNQFITRFSKAYAISSPGVMTVLQSFDSEEIR